MSNTTRSIIVLVWIVGICGLASCAQTTPINSPADANAGPVDSTGSPRVDIILDELHNAASKLQSYQCRMEYLFSQPMLESKTLRTGTLHYARFGGGSKLRINFDTLTQDDGPQQNYKECYIFDGQWLTHIDYQIKQVQKRQLAESNEPIDAFELAKRNFPIIGFSKTDDLEREFEVNLASEPNEFIHLRLKVKPDSIYKDDYQSVEVWIDKESMLPARISAVSTEDDIYEIKFVAPLVNEPVNEKVFDLTIPEGFGEAEVVPLKNS